jgi:PAS domain S-box-containing protein
MKAQCQQKSIHDSQSIRVLFVEDQERDALLLLRNLTQGGFAVEWQRVDTEADMVSALQDSQWDLILCDYSIPGFGALAALKVYQNSGCDLPLIVVSGTVGEEVAVECMRLGAHDYLMKDKLTRLCEAVRRELRETETRQARLQAEKQLQESSRRLSTLMNNLPGMAYQCRNEMAWTMLFVSRGALDLTGYKPEELINNQQVEFSDITHPEDLQRVWETIQDGLAKDGHYIVEFRIITATGQIKHVWEQGVGVADASGAYTQLEGIMMDVSERVSYEQNQQSLNAVLRSIRSVNQLIIRKNTPEGLIHDTVETLVRERGFNHVCCTLTDDTGVLFTHAEASIGDYVPKIQKLRHKGELLPCFAQMGDLTKIPVLIPQNMKCGECRHYERSNDCFRLCGLLQHNGKAYGTLSVETASSLNHSEEEKTLFSDICKDIGFALYNIEREVEKEHAYEQMALAKQEAESANQAKDNFLAVMSHELRTPLNPIMGYVSLMIEDANQDDAQMMQSILDSCKRMLLLIERILDYSRFTQQAIKQSMDDFMLLEACQTAFNEIKCQSHGLQYLFNNGNESMLPVDPELIVVSDRSILIRILDNLLQNACKYTKSGSVSLSVGQLANNRKSGRYQFIVEDTGIGIEESEIPNLFKPFTQVDSSYSRPYEGVGLGLAICGRLIKMLDGEIEVSSKLGTGSRFTVSIPFDGPKTNNVQSAKAARLPQASLKLSKPLKVLIVEDVVDNMNVARALVTQIGGIPFTAYNGSEAIQYCQEQRFDAILMDLRMPGMDGFETTEQIKTQSACNQNTPIIALTANVADSIQEQCTQSGMTGFISKPVMRQSLYDNLAPCCK